MKKNNNVQKSNSGFGIVDLFRSPVQEDLVTDNNDTDSPVLSEKTLFDSDDEVIGSSKKEVYTHGLYSFHYIAPRNEAEDAKYFDLFKKIVESRFDNKIELYRGEEFVNKSTLHHINLVKNEKTIRHRRIHLKINDEEVKKEKIFLRMFDVFYNNKYDTVLHFVSFENSVRPWASRNNPDYRYRGGSTANYDSYNLKNMEITGSISEELPFNFLIHELMETYYTQNRIFRKTTDFDISNDLDLLYKPSHWRAMEDQALDLNAEMVLNSVESEDYPKSYHLNGWTIIHAYFKKSNGKYLKRTFWIRLKMGKVVIDEFINAYGKVEEKVIAKAQYLLEVEAERVNLNKH